MTCCGSMEVVEASCDSVDVTVICCDSVEVVATCCDPVDIVEAPLVWMVRLGEATSVEAVMLPADFDDVYAAVELVVFDTNVGPVDEGSDTVVVVIVDEGAGLTTMIDDEEGEGCAEVVAGCDTVTSIVVADPE